MMKNYSFQTLQNFHCSSPRPLVLVIDDSRFMRNYMTSILEKIGCQVICGSNGLEGVKLFQEHHPQVVLIDALMPVMDGYKASSIIRHMDAGKDTLIYMITTQAETESVEKAFEVGCDDYFVKPLMDNVFSTKLKKIMNEKHTTRNHVIDQHNLEIELAEAKELQMSLLPKTFKNYHISVTSIFSPFTQVSGDFIDYWWVDHEKTLYGYVLDVTGHSIASAMQALAIRMLFCQASKSTRNICEILQYINAEMFRNNKKRTIATAIIFSIDLKEKILQYSSAGISPFYLIGKTRNTVVTAGYPLGFKKNADYRLEEISLQGIQEVVFASDGFTELIDSQNEIMGKHDDASALLIKILK
jgi:CheY-like chemotaxis protein